MKKHPLTFLILFLATHSFSQQLILGKIESRVDKKPISYANIGIMNTPVGTLSNDDGTFTLFVPQKHQADTVVFAALGFERVFIPVVQLIRQRDNLIILHEKITTLQPVVVHEKKQKQKQFTLGNRYTRGGFLYADSISAGAAMGLLIDNKFPAHHADLTYPFTVTKARIFIDKNSQKEFKMRIRFMERDSLGRPGKDLMQKDILFTSSTAKGWINVDVSGYQFVATKPFFIVFEWIMDDKDRLSLLNEYARYRQTYPERVYRDSTEVDGQKIGFWSYRGFAAGTHLGVSGLQFSLDHYVCFYRTNSFGEWRRAPAILTARVDVTPVSN